MALDPFNKDIHPCTGEELGEWLKGGACMAALIKVDSCIGLVLTPETMGVLSEPGGPASLAGVLRTAAERIEEFGKSRPKG